MRELSPAELLEIWESAMPQPADQRALMLLSAAFPEEAAESLPHSSIGRRNGLLLSLRERLFGSRFVSVVVCPGCGERLELNFETADIRATADEPPRELTLQAAGYQVSFRLPNSLDLAHVRECQDAGQAEQTLLRRCLLSARRGSGKSAALEALPEEVVEAITQRMEEADPQANIRLPLSCHACRHQWQPALDPCSYLWRELDAWARGILREVHLLASAYGWSEHEILNMKPWRRQIYLGLAG